MSIEQICLIIVCTLFALHLLFDIYFVAYLYENKFFEPKDLKSKKECMNDICKLLNDNLSGLNHVVYYNKTYIEYLKSLEDKK